MPKHHTFPTLYDEVLQISITKLKEWEYLNPEQVKIGTITWSRNGNTTGSISIRVNTFSEQPFIELDYKYRDEPRNYKIQLVSVPSNLGKGLIWYFLCPQTNKRCRKMYSIGGYFLHREAFHGCMYESQTRSKYYRNIDKVYGPYFKQEKLYEQLYKKHFKQTYAGKPTKKYLRIMEQLEKAESIPYEEIERIMTFG
jgi:hypothetical protein